MGGRREDRERQRAHSRARPGDEIFIEAPAERVRQALGERFMHVSEWAAPIFVENGKPHPRTLASRQVSGVPSLPHQGLEEAARAMQRPRSTVAAQHARGMAKLRMYANAPDNDRDEEPEEEAPLAVRGCHLWR